MLSATVTFWGSRWGQRSVPCVATGLNPAAFPWECSLLLDQEFFNCHRFSCSAIIFSTINYIPQSLRLLNLVRKKYLFFMSRSCGREILTLAKTPPKHKSTNSFHSNPRQDKPFFPQSLILEFLLLSSAKYTAKVSCLSSLPAESPLRKEMLPHHLCMLRPNHN